MLLLLVVCMTVMSANTFLNVQAAELCPDKETTCPEDQVCCKTDGDKSGCCPRTMLAQKTFRGRGMNKVDSMKAVYDQVNVCPDPNYACFGTQPCCASANGWNCCPHTGGNCCADGLSCCARGKKCYFNRWCY